MTELIKQTAAETAAAIASGEVSAVEVAQAHLDRIAKVDDRINAFLHVDAEGALAAARAVDAKRAAGERLGPLAGVPLALKDLFTTRGIPTTCGSKILEGWLPPYDATVTRGCARPTSSSSARPTWTSSRWAPRPRTRPTARPATPGTSTRIPGGSGGGSAAALASVPGAAGHRHRHRRLDPPARRRDRHGGREADVRRGIALRHGRLLLVARPGRPLRAHRARRGAAARGDRRARPARLDLDRRPGPAVVEAAKLGAARGSRACASASSSSSPGGEGYQAGRRPALPGEPWSCCATLGAEVVEVDCPSFAYALPAYYLIAPSECSSNLARFDAMRYGLRVGDDGTHSAEEVTALTREAGFGAEVKRRIMLGTYALSSGYYDAYYGQAQKVRTLIIRDFEAAFAQVDVMVSPTTPTTAFKIGERADDPMAMYLADLCTIPTNLAGNAGMSLPCGLAPEDGLPVGLQILAPAMADERLYRVGAALEVALLEQWGRPILDSVPAL
jgi:aspartyl-tRNA(Asn)/glutamyl-tRNA(Gln) amidotransferase subunit A